MLLLVNPSLSAFSQCRSQTNELKLLKIKPQDDLFSILGFVLKVILRTIFTSIYV